MSTITIISIVIWPISLVGYVVFNLYRKNKKLEDLVIKQQIFINEAISNYKQIDLLVDKIDKTLWVQSDPEFLQLMEEIKNLQLLMKQYTESK